MVGTYTVGWREKSHFYGFLLENFGNLGTYTITDERAELVHVILTVEGEL